MGKDVSEVIGTAIGSAARDAIQNVSKTARKRSKSALPGPKGVAAGAAGLSLVALAPLATKGVSKIASKAADKGAGPLKGAGNKVSQKVEDKVKGAGNKVSQQVEDKVKGDVKDAIPGSGLFSKDGKSEGTPGVGQGRRMPVQQDIDIGVPISTVYNQWTQFEDWPKFMHRVTSVSQEDETHVKFKTKIWGKTKEFTAEIEEQRPDERIKWKVTEGVSHSGVVTFHELGPRLTRVELNLDLDPGSLIEKAARGMRHVKRAVRADMARFKAYVLMEEEESGAWRGRVEDGDVKKSSRRGNGSKASGSSRSSRPGSKASGSNASRSKASGSNASGSNASGSKASGSGSTQSRARSSSRRTRGATNGGSRRSSSASGSSNGRSSSGSGGRSASARSRSGSHA